VQTLKFVMTLFYLSGSQQHVYYKVLSNKLL